MNEWIRIQDAPILSYDRRVEALARDHAAARTVLDPPVLADDAVRSVSGARRSPVLLCAEARSRFMVGYHRGAAVARGHCAEKRRRLRFSTCRVLNPNPGGYPPARRCSIGNRIIGRRLGVSVRAVGGSRRPLR